MRQSRKEMTSYLSLGKYNWAHSQISHECPILTEASCITLCSSQQSLLPLSSSQ